MSEEVTEKKARELFLPSSGKPAEYQLETSEFQSEDGKKQSLRFLKHPWNDPTLILVLPKQLGEAKELASVLGAVDLPPKYSGIFHKEDQALEIFWTAYKVREKHEEVAKRKFDVWWRGEKRSCRFAEASEAAKTLVKYTFPFAAPSHTDHRNIISFHHYVHETDHSNMGVPMCFWVDCKNIRKCDLDEYLRTINFYMTYYDRETPRILIHETGLKDIDSTRPRYVEGDFPKELVAGKIDPSVVSFWLGAFETRDPAMKYLLHFRLIEFLAMAHLKSEQRHRLVNILRRPHLISSTEIAAAEIASIFSGQSRENERLKSFVAETVNREKVWAVLDANRAQFSTSCIFEGGHEIKPTIDVKTTLDNWPQNGPATLVDKLRAIRNCLAHGQDEGTRGVIHSSQRNRDLLMPWVNLIETFAAETMLYAMRTYVSGEAE